ncbi:MAG: DNA-binding MarR family transcriptional regulator [Saprospiraceae bacterium]|jgi:DNA-binding MarR family transcriptional regulator
MQYLEILVKLRKIIRSINLESKKIQKEYGISIPQLLVLQFLSKQTDYKASAKNIKNYINLNASTVSGIVSRIEEKGLVARLANPEDKRGMFVTLTAKGAELLRESPTTLQEKMSKRLQKLSTKQIEELNSSIETLTQLMDAENVDAAPMITLGEIPKQK